jgi:hypothetical protein
MLEKVMPLAKEYGAAVIGVITDENGIPATPQARLAVARKLLDRAAEYGVPAEDVIIDCLALTVGADHKAGQVTLDSIACAPGAGCQPEPGRQQCLFWLAGIRAAGIFFPVGIRAVHPAAVIDFVGSLR